MKIAPWFAQALLLGGLALGCEGSASPSSAPAVASWTVFVYGHGDHDLSPLLERDLAEMSQALLGDVQVVVLADFDERRSPGRQGSEWLLIPGGGAPPRLLERGPEQNLDAPEVLEASVASVFQRFPSRRRAVVLWGHGLGWRGFGGDSKNGSLPPGARKPMRLDELADALRRGLHQAGLKEPRSLDLLGFDACLMGGIETAFAFRDLTQTIVGSAELDYGEGWDYRGFLTYLAAHPEASSGSLAAEEVRLWDLHHGQGADDVHLRSQVALDTTHLDSVASEMRHGSELLAPVLDQARLPLARLAFFASPSYGADLGEQRRSGFIDLRQLAQGFAERVPDSALQAVGTRLVAALDRATIARSNGLLRQNQGALHIGVSRGEPSWIEEYRARAWAWDEASGWSRILQGVQEAADEVPPVFEAQWSPVQRPSQENPLQIKLRSEDQDVVGAVVMLLRREPDGAMVQLGLLGGRPLSPGQWGTVTWAGEISQIDAGAGEQLMAPQPWLLGFTSETSVQALFAVPGRFLEAEGEAGARLLFHLGIPEATSMLLERGGQLRAVEVRKIGCERPGGGFLPELPMRLPDGSLSTLPGKPISLECGQSLRRVPAEPQPGTYALLLNVLDAWGNVSTRVEPFVLE